MMNLQSKSCVQNASSCELGFVSFTISKRVSMPDLVFEVATDRFAKRALCKTHPKGSQDVRSNTRLQLFLAFTTHLVIRAGTGERMVSVQQRGENGVQ